MLPANISSEHAFSVTVYRKHTTISEFVIGNLENNMNYATIKTNDISNGPSIRVSLYVSGCTHHCNDCFNPETWDFKYGQIFDASVTQKIINALNSLDRKSVGRERV